MESMLLSASAEIAAIQTEVQGMVALNQFRTNRGEVIAYNEEAFKEKAQLLWGISSYILKNRG